MIGRHQAASPGTQHIGDDAMTDPLLTYALAANPPLIRPGTANVLLTVIATNTGQNDATVGSITVSLPVGDDPTDLVSADTVAAIKATALTPGWSVAKAAAPSANTCNVVLTCTKGIVVAPSASVILTLSAVAINAAEGNVAIAISEASSQPPASATLDIVKTAATQLTYAVVPAQVPVEGAGVTITITAANITNAPIHITNFQITVPPDLVPDPTSITPNHVTANCAITALSPGVFSVTPTRGPLAPSSNMVVSLANLVIDENPATSYLTIKERVAGNSTSSSLPIAKQQVPLTILRFEPLANTIDPGQSTSLLWATAAASSCTITGPDGQQWANQPTNSGLLKTPLTVSPLASTTYWLEAYGATEPVTQPTSLTVRVPQIVSFTASQSSVDIGDTLTFDWDVEYASGGVTLLVVPTGMVAPAPFVLVAADKNMDRRSGRATITPVPTVTTEYTLIVSSNITGVMTASSTVPVNSALPLGWVQTAQFSGIFATPDSPPSLFAFQDALWFNWPESSFDSSSGQERQLVMRSTDGSSWTSVNWQPLGPSQNVDAAIVDDKKMGGFMQQWAKGTTALADTSDGQTWTMLANPLDTSYSFGARQSLFVGIGDIWCAVGGYDPNGNQTNGDGVKSNFINTSWTLNINDTTPGQEFGFNFYPLPFEGLLAGTMGSVPGATTCFSGKALAFWTALGFWTSPDGQNWSAANAPAWGGNGNVVGISLTPVLNELWLLGASANPQSLAGNERYVFGGTPSGATWGTQTGNQIYSTSNTSGPWSLVATIELPDALSGRWLSATMYQDHLFVSGSPMSSYGDTVVYLYNNLLPGQSFDVTNQMTGSVKP
jgi:hypothetical protein